MSTDSNVLHFAARSTAIDLSTHPLAADGFNPRYRIATHTDLGGEEPCPNACIEVLADQGTMAAFKAEAELAGTAVGLSGPICEPAADYGGSPWRFADVVGPSAMILELALVAQRLGCERRPFNV